ncbi:MinD/ParA family protein, partial [Mycobacterium sp. ITM-2017-0098]
GAPWPGQFPPEGPHQPSPYTERIRADALVPPRKVVPGRGWRRALYRATFGLINLGPSPEERRLAELEAQI